MGTRRSWLIGSALLLAAVIGLESRAEIAVETDAFGNYVKTTVLTQSSVRQQRVWRVVRRHVGGLYPLNPDGDRLGDLFPSIGENRVDRNHPWAVWSRFNGEDFDLVWSRWKERTGWTTIQPLTGEPQIGDDVAPQLVFDPTGRPFLAWWRDENGTGSVYLSFFLATRWMPPVRVSDASVDSRSPRLGFHADGSVRVEFQTASGLETRSVYFPEPTTITDDLDPCAQLVIKGPLPAPVRP